MRDYSSYSNLNFSCSSLDWNPDESKRNLLDHEASITQQESAQQDWLDRQERMKQRRAETAARQAKERQEAQEREEMVRVEAAAQAQAEEDAKFAALDDGTDIPPWHRGDYPKPEWVVKLLLVLEQNCGGGEENDEEDEEDTNAVHRLYRLPKKKSTKKRHAESNNKTTGKKKDDNQTSIYSLPSKMKKAGAAVKNGTTKKNVAEPEVSEEIIEIIEEEINIEHEYEMEGEESIGEEGEEVEVEETEHEFEEEEILEEDSTGEEELVMDQEFEEESMSHEFEEEIIEHDFDEESIHEEELFEHDIVEEHVVEHEESEEISIEEEIEEDGGSMEEEEISLDADEVFEGEDVILEIVDEEEQPKPEVAEIASEKEIPTCPSETIVPQLTHPLELKQSTEKSSPSVEVDKETRPEGEIEKDKRDAKSEEGEEKMRNAQEILPVARPYAIQNDLAVIPTKSSRSNKKSVLEQIQLKPVRRIDKKNDAEHGPPFHQPSSNQQESTSNVPTSESVMDKKAAFQQVQLKPVRNSGKKNEAEQAPPTSNSESSEHQKDETEIFLDLIPRQTTIEAIIPSCSQQVSMKEEGNTNADESNMQETPEKVVKEQKDIICNTLKKPKDALQLLVESQNESINSKDDTALIKYDKDSTVSSSLSEAVFDTKAGAPSRVTHDENTSAPAIESTSQKPTTEKTAPADTGSQNRGKSANTEEAVEEASVDNEQNQGNKQQDAGCPSNKESIPGSLPLAVASPPESAQEQTENRSISSSSKPASGSAANTISNKESNMQGAPNKKNPMSSKVPWKNLDLKQSGNDDDDEEEDENEKSSYVVPWKNFKLKPRIKPEELMASKVHERVEHKPSILKPAFVVTREQLRASKPVEKLEHKPVLKKAAVTVTEKQLETSEVKQKLMKKKAPRKPFFTVSKKELESNVVQEKLHHKPDLSNLHAPVQRDKMVLMKKKLKHRELSFRGASDLVTSANTDEIGSSARRPSWREQALVMQQSARELLADADIHDLKVEDAIKKKESVKPVWTERALVMQQSARELLADLDNGDVTKQAANTRKESQKPAWTEQALVMQQSARELLADMDSLDAGKKQCAKTDKAGANNVDKPLLSERSQVLQGRSSGAREKVDQQEAKVPWKDFKLKSIN